MDCHRRHRLGQNRSMTGYQDKGLGRIAGNAERLGSFLDSGELGGKHGTWELLGPLHGKMGPVRTTGPKGSTGLEGTKEAARLDAEGTRGLEDTEGAAGQEQGVPRELQAEAEGCRGCWTHVKV